jgi:hypothetical protein
MTSQSHCDACGSPLGKDRIVPLASSASSGRKQLSKRLTKDKSATINALLPFFRHSCESDAKAGIQGGKAAACPPEPLLRGDDNQLRMWNSFRARLESASGVYTELQCGSYIFMDADYGRNLDRDGGAVTTFEPSLFV